MKKSTIILLLVIIALGCGYNYAQAEQNDVKKEAIEQTQVKNDTVQVVEENSTTSEYPQSYVQEGYQDVEKAYSSMINSYSQKQIDPLLKLISDKKDVVFVTAGSRVFVGKDEISKAFKNDFDTIKKVNIAVPWISVNGNGNMAWLSAVVTASMDVAEGKTDMTARQTVVFEKENNEWKIVNSHLSYPAKMASNQNQKPEAVNKVEETK